VVQKQQLFFAKAWPEMTITTKITNYVGLLINFGQLSLTWKRFINTNKVSGEPESPTNRQKISNSMKGIILAGGSDPFTSINPAMSK
jgi:hypothetical protein